MIGDQQIRHGCHRAQTFVTPKKGRRQKESGRGWDVVETHSDEGISGAKGCDQRPGLDGMLKDAGRRRFDVAMAWAIDRLGRSLIDLLETIKHLEAVARGGSPGPCSSQAMVGTPGVVAARFGGAFALISLATFQAWWPTHIPPIGGTPTIGRQTDLQRRPLCQLDCRGTGDHQFECSLRGVWPWPMSFRRNARSAGV